MPTAYVTCPPADAPALARRLVDERLAACVNRVTCRSTYRWEDDVLEEDEEILVCKTSEAGFAALRDRVLELHPHDVPCIERFDEAAVHPPFAAWIDESVVAEDG